MKKIKSILIVTLLSLVMFSFTFTTANANQGDAGDPHAIIKPIKEIINALPLPIDLP